MPARKTAFVRGGYYHFYNRGAGRQSIFQSDENYRFLLRLMRKAMPDLKVSVIAYCLLPNHYHWLIRQVGELPAGLLPQRVFNRYSKAFNNQQGRSGTLFEGRYKVIAVESDEYLRHLCRYIHLNPVRHGFAQDPAAWPYSNYLEWVNGRAGKLVDREFIVAHFRDARVYEEYVRSFMQGCAHPPQGLADYLVALEQDRSK